jgi:hypothetical protein
VVPQQLVELSHTVVDEALLDRNDLGIDLGVHAQTGESRPPGRGGVAGGEVLWYGTDQHDPEEGARDTGAPPRIG